MWLLSDFFFPWWCREKIQNYWVSQIQLSTGWICSFFIRSILHSIDSLALEPFQNNIPCVGISRGWNRKIPPEPGKTVEFQNLFLTPSSGSSPNWQSLWAVSWLAVRADTARWCQSRAFGFQSFLTSYFSAICIKHINCSKKLKHHFFRPSVKLRKNIVEAWNFRTTWVWMPTKHTLRHKLPPWEVLAWWS